MDSGGRRHDAPPIPVSSRPEMASAYRRIAVRWVSGGMFGLEFTGIRPAQRERVRAIIMKANL